MTANLSQLILAAIVVAASIAAISELSSGLFLILGGAGRNSRGIFVIGSMWSFLIR